MELRQVEYVVGVAEHGGFTRAAAALHVTQPALSEGVARLEAELGVELFHRVGRRVVLSAAGEAFLDPARRLLRDREVLTSSVGAVVGLVAGSLDLVTLPTLAGEPLAPLVGRFRRAHPGVVVHVDHPEEDRGVADWVRRGDAELGLADLPIDGPGLVTERLLTQELVAVLAPDAPLASRKRLSVRDLAATPLVLTPPGTPMRLRVDQAFADAGVSPPLGVVTDQRDAIVAMVLAGAGATILPDPLAATAKERGAAVVPLTPRLRRDVGLVWRDAPLSPAARAFLALSRT